MSDSERESKSDAAVADGSGEPSEPASPVEPTAVTHDSGIDSSGSNSSGSDSSGLDASGFESAGVSAESVIEAILFSTDAPLSAGKIAKMLGVGDGNDVRAHIDTLNERYEAHGNAFRIESIAKGYQMLTRPLYNNWVKKLQKARGETRLSSAALETLAIVAYKQPVLRADVEVVRGVAVGDMLVRLRDMNLVRIVGRAEEIGRPLLYGTTAHFLQAFGLGTLKDLPKIDPDQPGKVPPLKVAASEVGGCAVDASECDASECDASAVAGAVPLAPEPESA